MATSASIRVAEVGELPPGKGKVLELPDRRVTVYNREGHFYGSSTRRYSHGGASTTDCSQHGRSFDVFAEDSPATLHADEVECTVFVEGEYVYVLIPDR
jgi:hypothetical protein